MDMHFPSWNLNACSNYRDQQPSLANFSVTDKMVHAYVFGRDPFGLTITIGPLRWPMVGTQGLELNIQAEKHWTRDNDRIRRLLIGYLPIKVAFAIIAFPIDTYRVGFLPQSQPSFRLNPLLLQLFHKRLPPKCTKPWVSNPSIAKTLVQ